MKFLDTNSDAEVKQQLQDAMQDKIHKGEQELFSKFIDQFLESAYIREFEGRRVTDVLGYIFSLWRFSREYDRSAGAARINVYNPDIETHGWQSPHTVIYVLMANIPFVVDSVRIALTDMNIRTQGIQHAVMYPKRSSNKYEITEFISRSNKSSDGLAEALMCIEVDRVTSKPEMDALQERLESVMEEVQVAVGDYPAMLKQLDDIKQGWAKDGHSVASADEVAESSEFLTWLGSNSFTFLGYVEYDLTIRGKDKLLVKNSDSALGVLETTHESDAEVNLKDVPDTTREHILKPSVFLFAKSSRRSRVHRPAYADYVVVKRFDKKGKLIGERRFLGLYTARAFSESPSSIPMIRQKIALARKMSGFDARDHCGKEYEQLLAVFPRDELFQVNAGELNRAIDAALFAQERRKVNLYIREDAFGRFVCVLVYVPRDLFNTDLRLKIQNILMEALDGVDIDLNTFLSESPLARTQFNIRLEKKLPDALQIKELEKKIVSVVQSWHDDLESSLADQYGEANGTKLALKYRTAFNASYREMFSPRRAAADVSHIEEVATSGGLSMSFYRALDESDSIFHVKVFHADVPVTLSDVMPIFENMGFRVFGESPFKIATSDDKKVWMHDFSLGSNSGEDIDLSLIKDNFEQLFKEVWAGRAENDRFNRLLVTAYIGWRDIAVVRSYARYMRQIRVSNSQDLISDTVVNHGELVLKLLEMFDVRFNPKLNRAKNKAALRFSELEDEFKVALDDVPNLTDDKILRLYVDLIKATVRTNFYQLDKKSNSKPYIAFKFLPRQIPNVPLPVPMFEIFVYSPRIEGVHLRGGKVARGGLRWSDRNEDYRTEVLGLVKAQQVKNAVIVPVGAKGGFVAKQLPQNDRAAFMEEGIACYQIFISALLDVTDNLISGEVIPPKNTVRHDEDDYYLVVAADKGTATFSDIANKISIERCHWLGDAFASGGSQGYDHKKMGITARGAWVSVQRHFRELGHDVQKQDFTCIGVGDMAGDVFGNGMLLSDCTKLVAAFNHMHIFLDPNPDPKKSFAERKRLFETPGSSWQDYDEKLISRGGGIFSRASKSIKLSKEVKTLLGVADDSLAPNQLMTAILKAQVDLLWFGGIGTYVKSSDESDADAGDKANDGIRVDAKDLKVRVVGEGANLGMTQLSRVEYAMHGGRLNTDFIDNAAGVDCSDHEVNIKILLNDVVAKGDLTEKQRNKLLFDMTDSVADHVLLHNYRQTQAISIARHDVVTRMEEYRRLMNSMESAGKLNRSIEFLPCDEEIVERKSKSLGLTSPELAVLISYVKGDLKERLNCGDFTSDAYLTNELLRVFPERLVKKFSKEIESHQLKPEIVATQVANDMVNHMGITFVERLQNSTGANSTSIAFAYIIARDVFGLEHWWAEIEALDYKVPADLQLKMMAKLVSLMRRACRWLIRNRRSELNVVQNRERFLEGDSICREESVIVFARFNTKKTWDKKYDEMVDAGVPEELASFIAATPFIYSALGIIEAHESSSETLERVSEVYYTLGSRLELNWFAQQINELAPLSHWQALAREAFREDLDWQQRALTVGLLGMKKAPKDIDKRIDMWMNEHQHLIERWKQTLTEIKATEDAEFSMYSVALRELLDLAQSTAHAHT